MNQVQIVCSRTACKSVLGFSTGQRVIVGGAASIAQRVTLTCLKCGAKRQWRPSTVGPEKR